MKPLVFYCRWHDAALRLRGRDETAVWGHLVYQANTEQEWLQAFRFDLQSWQLTLEEPSGKKVIQLDEMGTVLEES